MDFAKFLKTPIFIEHLYWLLLHVMLYFWLTEVIWIFHSALIVSHARIWKSMGFSAYLQVARGFSHTIRCENYDKYLFLRRCVQI